MGNYEARSFKTISEILTLSRMWSFPRELSSCDSLPGSVVSREQGERVVKSLQQIPPPATLEYIQRNTERDAFFNREWTLINTNRNILTEARKGHEDYALRRWRGGCN